MFVSLRPSFLKTWLLKFLQLWNQLRSWLYNILNVLSALQTFNIIRHLGEIRTWWIGRNF